MPPNYSSCTDYWKERYDQTCSAPGRGELPCTGLKHYHNRRHSFNWHRSMQECLYALHDSDLVALAVRTAASHKQPGQRVLVAPPRAQMAATAAEISILTITTSQTLPQLVPHHTRNLTACVLINICDPSSMQHSLNYTREQHQAPHHVDLTHWRPVWRNVHLQPVCWCPGSASLAAA